MTIHQVDLDDRGEFHAWFEAGQEVWNEAWPGDPPWAGEEEMRALFVNNPDSDRILFVARGRSGNVEGVGEVDLPKKDNLHVANLEVKVRSASRGRGIGRALLERAEQIAGSHGREVLIGSTWGRKATLDAREAHFARAAGYAHARTEVRREIAFPVDAARLEELERTNIGAARDYDIVSWWRRCPDELVEGRARLATTLTTDEPHGDLDVEAERFDVERVRRWEADLETVGRVLACTGAVSKTTRELAAVTEIGLARPGEDLAIQFATVVAREHRGHRLGILVKVRNLELIAGNAPGTERICTWNAESNEHMIRVNEALGFEVAGMAFNWQRTTA